MSILKALERLSRCSLVAGYYHIINDIPPLHIAQLYACKTRGQFVRDLDVLLRTHTPLDVHELLGHVRAGRPVPARSLLLTFDDGFREIHDVVAPILRHKGVPGLVFINTDFVDNRRMCYEHKKSIILGRALSGPPALISRISAVLGSAGWPSSSGLDDVRRLAYRDRAVVEEIGTALEIDFDAYLREYRPYLTRDQIRSLMADGFGIGSHSLDHPLYRDLPLAEQMRQTVESLQWIRLSFGITYGLFAFPHSDRGVSSRFFDQLTETGLADLTFGTGGLLDDSQPRHVQRMSFEKPLGPVQRSLRRHLLRRFYRRARGLGTVARPSE